MAECAEYLFACMIMSGKARALGIVPDGSARKKLVLSCIFCMC